MSEIINTDICVIGAGSGGLTVAAVAAQLGADTILIERGAMGGDCLNTGCVPSKALLAAAHRAEDIRGAGKFGITATEPEIFGPGVQAHVKGAIAQIAPHDSIEQFEKYGVRIIQADAAFTGPDEVAAGDARIRARRFVVATGSSPMTPPIDGLADVAYLTNENLFELTEVPAHLIVIGGGPIGIELAQAYRLLGARVSVIEMMTALGGDDPELVAVVKASLAKDGVEIFEGAKVLRAGPADAGVMVEFEKGGAAQKIEGSHLLVAAGRRPNLDGLNLDAAGIKTNAKGIRINASLRTSNRRVYAVGDVAGDQQFTHVAAYHADIFIRNALFRIPAKLDRSAYVRVTYTSPELAQVGLTEAEAKSLGGQVRVIRWPFSDNDRAIAEGATEGLIKLVIGRRGKILGAGIVGAHAGELIQSWGLAISAKLKIGKLANFIAPYPTLGEANKRAAGEYFTPSLFGPRTRALVKFLSRFG
ncbi:MAG: FAD-dependent oxidoreductase [Rhodospirillaceae bacterium]|jgi:pyruvate/2-oxoglutarate dehydrogenase complex dihydrolipoamide dehydrogenase (E3) component|nr:FAD-dependent oxidoreductase [Rhodospirillaceae bacterium]MBT3887602.1 FAD-dependent oxidoreductase [Rhodospirillaceae bacterium]MBT4751447.1 FAD-dependent oxidoreductase [Rhodospirillaceae bacterium]MBT5839541.1 FAD-dependent oxidoreductase [Rhodospirillaceae bacterium]MBT6290929.1 FAD-dependent oxidoreductase [Rhodospirillaceae bacterium]